MGFSLRYLPRLTGAWECLSSVKPRYPFPAPWPPSGLSAFISLFCICGAGEFSFEFPVFPSPLSPATALLPNLLTAPSCWLLGAKNYCQFVFAQLFTVFLPSRSPWSHPVASQRFQDFVPSFAPVATLFWVLPWIPPLFFDLNLKRYYLK